ncbi:LysE family translocator [Alcaligenes aquatilis]|uniref:LysE family translocator n=1 Tax=Alcaligenes aquatilis TaxID=323284 RepID=A0ABY4NL86_9BURK|nr:LysE family translocator [Alcaligenes aquatilis]UQN37249.1 LysE family translocator [Alcaligenes aquatilis]
MTSNYLPLILFCLSTSISPGPANLLAMISGAKFGIWRSLPVFFGILIGFNIIILLTGIGLGNIFQKTTLIYPILKYIGILYMLYLAYSIIRSDANPNESTAEIQPVSFISAALLQWVNPKAWIMAVGAISAYSLPDSNPLLQSFLIAMVFFFVGAPCIAVWLISGSMMRQFLSNPKNMKIFNYITGGLLFLSITLTIF